MSDKIPAIELRRDVEIAVVRLVQEALSNILKHRGPGDGLVRFAVSEQSMVVTVANSQGPTTDDSAGHSPGEPSGRGLIGMRERIEACGGHLTVESTEAMWTVTAVVSIGKP